MIFSTALKKSGILLALASCLHTSTAAAEPLGTMSVATVPLPSGLDSKRHATNKFIAKNDFLGLFQRARLVGDKEKLATYILDAPVRSYLDNCCKDMSEVYTLLLQSGFEIGPNVAASNDFRELGFDDVRIVKRRAWNTGLPDDTFAYRAYEITLQARQSKLQQIYAKTYVVADGKNL